MRNLQVDTEKKNLLLLGRKQVAGNKSFSASDYRGADSALNSGHTPCDMYQRWLVNNYSLREMN